MRKHPYKYTGSDFKEILNKPIRIITGNQDSDEDDKVIEGKITYCLPSTNPPHIPVYVDFKLNEGEKIKVYIQDMKSIDVLE